METSDTNNSKQPARKREPILGSFQWKGKTARGASKWVGTWSAPPRWFCIGFLGYGCLAGTVGILLSLARILLPVVPPAFFALNLVGIIHGVVFSSIGGWMLWQRRRILSLAGTEELSEKLKIDPQTLEREAEERGIKPIYNINGRDLYDPADFDPSVILLRPSSEPTNSPETLLRPIETAPSQTPIEQLLRITEAEAEEPETTSLSIGPTVPPVEEQTLENRTGLS